MSARLRCAIYTRVSTEHGLEQEFNSLDNQREAAEAYVKSQANEGWTSLRDRYDDGGFSGGSMERPALLRLLEAIRSRRIDVVVVYKVDRLTRSLADFAKLVELFDGHGVSFVSVTQAFNTTSSMGRLTLNVLLSFAQFEREVTSERIRDKTAASKRRGLWVGGMVPLGYAVEARKIVVVEPEAERVRHIFQRYLALGSLVALVDELHRDEIVTKVRPLATGRTIGGIAFTRGPLAGLLHNRFYIAEIAFKDAIYAAEHPAILDRALFEAVQAKLREQGNGRIVRRGASGALLTGRLYDELGRRMSPTHANKAGRRYCYYTTASRPGDREPLRRIPAPELERLVREAIPVDAAPGLADRERIKAVVERIDLATDHIVIALRSDEGPGRTITLPWRTISSRRHREVIAVVDRSAPTRLMRSETRATLLQAIAKARRWMNELASGAIGGTDAIASREGCSPWQVTAILSLAHLAPDIVEAAIAGRLPHGISLRTLTDAPVAWSRQRASIGLAPAAV